MPFPLPLRLRWWAKLGVFSRTGKVVFLKTSVEIICTKTFLIDSPFILTFLLLVHCSPKWALTHSLISACYCTDLPLSELSLATASKTTLSQSIPLPAFFSIQRISIKETVLPSNLSTYMFLCVFFLHKHTFQERRPYFIHIMY